MLFDLPVDLLESFLADDPFHELDIPKGVDFDSVTPMSRFWSESRRDSCDTRGWAYDIPRTRYFRDRYMSNRKPAPIHLIACPDGKLRVHNGYHRLCGALLARPKTVSVIVWQAQYDIKGSYRTIDKIQLRLRARTCSRTS